MLTLPVGVPLPELGATVAVTVTGPLDPTLMDEGASVIEVVVGVVPRWGTKMLRALRPCVAATSVREAVCMRRPRTARLGQPFEKVAQLVPPIVERKTPRSVATYKVLEETGSMTMSLAGILG